MSNIEERKLLVFGTARVALKICLHLNRGGGGLEPHELLLFLYSPVLYLKSFNIKKKILKFNTHFKSYTYTIKWPVCKIERNCRYRQVYHANKFHCIPEFNLKTIFVISNKCHWEKPVTALFKISTTWNKPITSTIVTRQMRLNLCFCA